MTKWIYLGDNYKSIPIDWEELAKLDYYETYTDEKYSELIVRNLCSYGTEEILVYHPKWGTQMSTFFICIIQILLLSL